MVRAVHSIAGSTQAVRSKTLHEATHQTALSCHQWLFLSLSIIIVQNSVMFFFCASLSLVHLSCIFIGRWLVVGGAYPKCVCTPQCMTKGLPMHSSLIHCPYVTSGCRCRIKASFRRERERFSSVFQLVLCNTDSSCFAIP